MADSELFEQSKLNAYSLDNFDGLENRRYSGVYALIFNSDAGNRIYIGSTTVSFSSRIKKHLSKLRGNNHPNKYIQCLWNKYKSFEIMILEIWDGVDEEELRKKEDKWISMIPSTLLVNLGHAYPSPTYGKPRSLETRAKISRAKLGRPGNQGRIGKFHGLETRKKMSESHRGERHPLFGKHQSDETKKKIGEANRGRKNGPHSIETREKISKSNLGRVMSTKVRDALLKSHLGILASEDTKNKISEGMKTRWQDKEYREKVTALIREAKAKKKRSVNLQETENA